MKAALRPEILVILLYCLLAHKPIAKQKYADLSNFKQFPTTTKKEQQKMRTKYLLMVDDEELI